MPFTDARTKLQTCIFNDALYLDLISQFLLFYVCYLEEMAARPVTPHAPYEYLDLPVPASWETGSVVVQTARETLERRIRDRLAALKSEKMAALEKAMTAAANARAKGAANANSLSATVNRLRAEANAVGLRVLPKTDTSSNAAKLREDIKIFSKSVSAENATRTASAKSLAATTPPQERYRVALLAKLKAHNARNPGTKLAAANLARYKKNTLNTLRKSLGTRVNNSTDLENNAYFFDKYKGQNFSGGAKRATKRMTRRMRR